MSKKPSLKQQLTNSFTFDSDTTGIKEIPSISVLLKRKKFELTRIVEVNDLLPENEGTLEVEIPPQVQKKADPEPEEPGIPESIQIPSDETSSEFESVRLPSQTKVQPSRRGKSKPKKKIISWDRKALKKSSDPLAKGLNHLMEAGAQNALFLAISLNHPVAPAPHFVASAAVADRSKIQTWEGLHWDPVVVPELWNSFVKDGLVELPPPGPDTVATSDRNVVRAAFDLQKDEWLTLLRIGPQEKCRGLLVLISKKTLLKEAEKNQKYISAVFPQTDQKNKKKVA